MKKLLINDKPKNPDYPTMNFTLEHSQNGSEPCVILMATNDKGTRRGILEITADCRVLDTGYFKDMGFELVSLSFKK